MQYTIEKLTYFYDMVRRWHRAIDNNDFQTIKDTQKALTQMGAYYQDGLGWVYGDADERNEF